MTLVRDLIANTRSHLHGVHRAEYNFLTGNINSSASTFTFDLAAGGIVRNAVVCIDDEYLFIKSVAGQIATVFRGWNGSTAAAHTAGDVIEVSSRFPQPMIRQALLDEIRSWPRSLYRKDSYMGSASSTTTSIDLPVGDLYQILEVRRSPRTGQDRWLRIKEYETVRDTDLSVFPSGVGLHIFDPLPTTCDIMVRFSAPFDLDYFDDDIDLVVDVGLGSSMLDIPAYGAAWRLLAPREIRRTFTESQGESRNAEEVPAGAAITTARQLMSIRDRRLVEEGDRLAAATAVHW